MEEYNLEDKTKDEKDKEHRRQQFIAVNNEWRAGCIANRVVSPAVVRQYAIDYYKRQKDNQ